MRIDVIRVYDIDSVIEADPIKLGRNRVQQMAVRAPGDFPGLL